MRLFAKWQKRNLTTMTKTKKIKIAIGITALIVGFSLLLIAGGLVDGSGTLKQIDSILVLAILNTAGGLASLRLEGAL